MVCSSLKAVLGREIERVDAAEIAIRRFMNGAFDRRRAIGVGGLSQHAEEGFGFAHCLNSPCRRAPEADF